MARYFSGQRLRQARTGAGLSAERLAADINRSIFSVRSYESGRIHPSVETLAAIADTLDIATDSLFELAVPHAAA